MATRQKISLIALSLSSRLWPLACLRKEAMGKEAMGKDRTLTETAASGTCF